ncbi:Ig-like domain-containing protein [Deinococcus alpinitundrae]|uniref:Ig-like domain-containing protein n=1 Tax=Deinococcus alpinitundrae TaxID=468913 RepID=UPI00137B656A|nr:Ig-like domain-containing protein [Deinococcus alpinitundrae]
MKTFIPILGLSLLLAACNTPTPPPTTASISIDGPATLKIGEDKTLTASAKSNSGTVLSGHTFTWTSSAPNVVAVDASGKLTVKRLSASPVTLTATDGGKSGTLSVTTYGLELTMGTINYLPGTTDARIGTAALVKFRGPGNSIGGTNAVQLTGPADVNVFNLEIGPLTTNEYYSFNYAGSIKPVSGSYSATATIDGITYTSSNILNSASVLGAFKNGKVQFTNSKDYTISGEFSSGTKSFRESFYNTTDPAADPIVFAIDAIPDLPVSYTSSVALSKATYSPYIDSFTLEPGNFTTLTPEVFNISITSLPDVTVN